MSILVIGGVTLDTLHLPGIPEPVNTSGGAGLYTALGARRAGASVTLFAHRPNPRPDLLQPVFNALNWIGPEIPLVDLPRLEIAHYGGGKAQLLAAHWGAQAYLTPNDLPPDLSEYRFIHLAVMATIEQQLAFLRACRMRSNARISAGTNGKTAHTETEAVRELIRKTDMFFMNENETNATFGSVDNAHAEPGNLLFITLGERGVLVYDGVDRAYIPAPAVVELDPTGAGDAFCGATIAGLANGLEAVSATRAGVSLASEMIQGLGPERLLSN
jgi:sugar/nucleoside kinase (ribokinase family)